MSCACTPRAGKLLVFLLVLFLWGLISAGVSAQDRTKEVGHLFLQNYSPKVFKAGTQNWCAVQDRRGIMLFGNRDGVLEYDGISWNLIRLTHPSLVRSLARDSSGCIYVGAKGDFGYLTPDSVGRMTFRSLIDQVPQDQRDFGDVWKIHAVGKSLVFETEGRLFLLDTSDRRLTSFAATTKFHRSFMVDGHFFVSQRNLGLFTLRGDSLVDVPGGSFFSNLRVYSILPIHPGRMLVATMEKGLYLMEGNSIRPFESEANAFLIKHQVYSGMRLHNGLFVLGTRSGGAVVIDSVGEIHRFINKSTGLQDDGILSLFQDADNGLWMTLNKGISRVEIQTPMTKLDERVGLQGTVYSAFRFENRLYVGTDIGVFRSRSGNERPLRFEPVAGIKGQCWSFWSDGRTLLVGNAEGIYRVDADRAEWIQGWQHTFCFHRSRHDSAILYVGFRNGLGILRYHNGRWKSVGTVEGLDEEIRSIGESEDGRLWAGTRAAGLIQITGDIERQTHRIERWGPTDGLPPGGIQVFPIQKDYVFSGRGGLYRFDTNRSSFVLDTLVNPLLMPDPRRDIRQMVEDAFERIWIYDYAERRSESVVAVHQPDGSYSIDRRFLARLSDFEVGVFFPEDDGVVWIGGSDGLVRYDTRSHALDRTPFSTCLRRITLRDETLYGGAGVVPQDVTVPYRLEKLRFEFAGSFFDNEAATHYQHWLEGFDETWSTWTTETWKDYSQLPPRDYRFHVRARNVYGVVAEDAIFAFTVMPPWYWTWWALALYGTAFSLFVVVIIRYRSRHLQDDKKRLEALVEERTEKISKQNEELHRLYDKQNEFMGIVAHDLRSPLSAIVNVQSMMSDEIDRDCIDREEWKDNLAMINRAATRMVVLIDDLLDISAIESGKLTLQLQDIHLSSLVDECSRIHVRSAAQKQIDVSIESRPDLPRVLIDKRRIAEVIDNLLSNAIKFTFPGGRVRLLYEAGEREVAVHVEDTGQGLTEQDLKELFAGFKKLSAQPTGGESSTGLGLVIVKKIVELHGGKIRVRSERGQGTTVSFTVPRSLTA